LHVFLEQLAQLGARVGKKGLSPTNIGDLCSDR